MPIQEREILQDIDGFQPNRTGSPNRFSVEFYKEFANSLVKLLQVVFQTCIERKIMPDSWKVA